MIPQLQLTTLIYLIIGTYGIVLAVEGAQLTTGLFKPCGTVATVLVLALLVFDKWAWSIRYLHPWFVDKPYIKGTWKGVLVSSYVNPETQQKIDPIEVYLVIRQSYSAIYLTLHTKQSTSETISNSFTKGADGAYTVASIYRNTPQIDHRDHSPIHYGAMLIRVAGSPVTHLRAEYWTDRLTQGEIHLTERSPKLYYDFDSASKGTYEKTDPQDGS